MRTRFQAKREREWTCMRRQRVHMEGIYSIQELIFVIAALRTANKISR